MIEVRVTEFNKKLFEKQILRFDEILDVQPKLDTEFELQDYGMM